MSRPLGSDHIGVVLGTARALAQHSTDHEIALQAFVAAADLQVRHTEEALSDALDVMHGSFEHVRSLLAAQLRRNQDGAEAARQLFAGAHQQRMAAVTLLTHLDRNFSPERGIGLDSQSRAVLVVDDYGGIREAIAEVLLDAGFVVRTATNGLEGLLTAYEMRPSVIVMDVTMPVLDGIEATRLIKATEATRQARVIAYTGNAISGDGPLHALFDAVVKKPATPAALLATVQHVASL